MTIDQLNKLMASGEPLLGGSQASKQMVALSAEARKLTMKINTVYHESVTRTFCPIDRKTS